MSEHLKLSFILQENSELTAIENLKLKIINELIETYTYYPTLADINLSYSSDQNNWSARPAFVMWDSAANIMKTEDYKKSKVNLYAYCNNSWIKKDKDKQYIPTQNQIKVSYNNLEKDLIHRFEFLVNSTIGKELHTEIKKQKGSWLFSIGAVTWYGAHNRNFEQEVKELFGDELMTKLNYLKLKEELPQKESSMKSKIKI